MNTKKRAIALILYVALCFSIVAGVIGNPADSKSKVDAQAVNAPDKHAVLKSALDDAITSVEVNEVGYLSAAGEDVLSVYIHNDVEYKIAEENGNTSNEENSLIVNGGVGDRKFENNDFLGKLYDFKVVYTTSSEATVDWQTAGLVEAYQYSLFETDNPTNTIEGLYASADGVLSIPAGWTAVVSVPRQIQETSENVTNVYAMELGVHNGTDKAGGILTPQSDKAFTDLPGNYKYGMNGEYSDGYTYINDLTTTTPIPTLQDLRSGLLALESAFDEESSDVVHFQFNNYYTWQIDFGTESDTEISEGDKSTTLDIDEDVKVTFENELGEENWLDGEGSVENIFGKTEDNQIYNP